ncbi:LLM class flavin-dependent oxidoreductase [Agromyces atrinae]|uniref:LLM class flavin-dependent oxidoreductase n=1 Tax=Agromyces atrinae TaxID=592376 RepID=A0A4Q2M4A2_9MICO|nr:LLM class flavin-dependent oxidoreductase [Agromyces atrinae]RXZ86884.1 LLM class flavin-dependent oxidoreductase [Agromyces atrinae]
MDSGRAMTLLVQARGVTDLADLRTRVDRWEALGLDGVVVTDHLFSPGRDRESTPRPPDTFVLLAAIATLSTRLSVGSLVANIGIVHPALVLRHAAQLAALVGGDRVVAGLGAGWNPEEFEALGDTMPGYGERMTRLESAVRFAREQFDAGIASASGSGFVADRVPLSPESSVPPRLLVGGGSERLLRLGGRYADRIDLNAPSSAGRISASDPAGDDGRRRLRTTDTDLLASIDVVRSAARDAGRPMPELSVFVDTVIVTDDTDVAAHEEALCRTRSIEPRSLAECPFVLIGSADAIARSLGSRIARLGLTRVILPDGPHLEALVAARGRAVTTMNRRSEE